MNIVEKYSHCQQMRIFFTPLLLTKRLFLLSQIPQSEFMTWCHVYQAVSHGVKTNVFHPSLLLRQRALRSWERLFQAFWWYVPDFNLEKLFTYNNNVLYNITVYWQNFSILYTLVIVIISVTGGSTLEVIAMHHNFVLTPES